MNYLELVQELFAECRLSGTAPTTLVGVTGEVADLKRWIRDAWNELADRRKEFFFRIADFSVSTASLASEYDPATDIGLTDFHDFRSHTFRYYLTSTGVRSEQFLEDMAYDDFRDFWLFGSRSLDGGPPVAVATSPTKTLLVGPVPNDDYTIRGQYISLEPELSDDTDEPGCPAIFHKLIVYIAMTKYGYAEVAQEVLVRADAEENKMLRRFLRHQLPVPVTGGPLA